MNSRRRIYVGSFGRLLDTDQLCSYLSMGRNSAIQFAEECGAKRKFGKSARYDRDVIDTRLNSMNLEDVDDAKSEI